MSKLLRCLDLPYRLGSFDATAALAHIRIDQDQRHAALLLQKLSVLGYSIPARFSLYHEQIWRNDLFDYVVVRVNFLGFELPIDVVD